MVAHAFNPSTWEAEAGGFLSSRPAWSTEWVIEQPGLHRETEYPNKQTNKQKNLQTVKPHYPWAIPPQQSIYKIHNIFTTTPTLDIYSQILWKTVKRHLFFHNRMSQFSDSEAMRLHMFHLQLLYKKAPVLQRSQVSNWSKLIATKTGAPSIPTDWIWL